MDWLTTSAIALGLAMDAFAVSIVVGSRLPKLTFRPLFRLSFHFGLFQFLMPIVGWMVGRQVSGLLHGVDHWIAFGLLLVIGLKMIYESRTHAPDDHTLTDPTRRWSLVLLSVATSIDALAIGLTIALLEVDVISTSLLIGVVAAVMTALGMLFGRQLGRRFGKAMELLGGVLLIGIGLNILLNNL